MFFVLVQTPYALLQCKQGFAYFRPVDSGLLIMTGRVGSSFVASKVNKGEQPDRQLPFENFELQNRVASRALIVLPRGACDS